MLAYTTLGASDLEAAVEFYGALTKPWAGKRSWERIASSFSVPP